MNSKLENQKAEGEIKVLIDLLRDCLEIIEIDIAESDDDESVLVELADKIMAAISCSYREKIAHD